MAKYSQSSQKVNNSQGWKNQESLLLLGELRWHGHVQAMHGYLVTKYNASGQCENYRGVYTGLSRPVNAIFGGGTDEINITGVNS